MLLKCSSCIGLKHRKVWLLFIFSISATFMSIWHHFTKSSGIFYPLFFSFQFLHLCIASLMNFWFISGEGGGHLYCSILTVHVDQCVGQFSFRPFCRFLIVYLYNIFITCPYASLSLFLILYLFARGETMHRDMTATQYKALSFIFDSFWNTFRYDSFKTYLHVSV